MSYFQRDPDPPADLTPQPVTPAPRRRGAPIGNTNAFKHGFYSSRFQSSELAALLTLPEGLTEEIALLRVCIRRIFDLSEQAASVDQGLSLLTTLGRSISILDRLLRTQKTIFYAQGIEHNNLDEKIFRPRRNSIEWYIDMLQTQLDKALNPPEPAPAGDPLNESQP